MAYVLVFIGLALIACIDYFGAFIAPSIPADELIKLGESSVMRITIIYFLNFLLGEILFGISTIRADFFPRIASVLFTIGFLTTPVRPAYPIAVFFGLTLSGIGLIWWGVSLWSMAGGG